MLHNIKVFAQKSVHLTAFVTRVSEISIRKYPIRFDYAGDPFKEGLEIRVAVRALNVDHEVCERSWLIIEHLCELL